MKKKGNKRHNASMKSRGFPDKNYNIFSYYDTDSSGQVDTAKLYEIVRACGVICNDKDIDTELKNSNLSLDDKIDYESFEKLLKKLESTYKPNKAELEDAFKFFEEQGNSIITVSRLAQSLEELGDKCSAAEIAEFKKIVDNDEDGNFDYKEVISLFFNE